MSNSLNAMTPKPAIPQIFDRALIARRLGKRPDAVDDFVTGIVLSDLAARLSVVSRRFERAAIIAPTAALAPEAVPTEGGIVRFTPVASLVDAGGHIVSETPTLPARDYDLIVSLYDLGIIDDVPGYLARARAYLRPDGLFLAAAVGGESFGELRAAFALADTELYGGAYARVAPFLSLGSAAGLLQRASFALPVADVERHIMRYRDPIDLMRDLKAHGASNPLLARPRLPMTRSLLERATTTYRAIATDPDGRVRATLEILWMSGWAPHESQSQPLRPGSSSVSLATALGHA